MKDAKNPPRTLLLACTLAAALSAPAVVQAEERILLGVDRDDDDVDGQPDAEQTSVPHSPDLYTLVPPQGADRTIEVRGANIVRVLVDGRPFPSGPLPASTKRIELQAVRPGRAEVRAFGRTIAVSAVEIRAVDGQGKLVDPVRSHASLERTPPERIDDAYAKTANPDAVRFVVVGLPDDLPPSLRLLSRGPSGVLVDALGDALLSSVPCPDGVAAGMTCGSTRPIRAVPDEIDRDHPMVHDRSILAEVGGGLEVTSPSARKLGGLRVGGPRASKLGPLVRFRGRLRVLLVRARPGGPPPIGGNDAGALAIAREEAAQASALWGACGIHFGPPGELEAEVVDPPRPHLLALGCDQGLPASGGAVRVRVDGREITATLERGVLPGGAARVVGAAITAAGFSVRISDNATIGAGAHGSSDVLVRRRDGQLATIEPPASGSISTDATMTACIGRVDLEDGLQHFGDIDAIAGTVEERTLIKAFDDGDPGTIEVLLVPSFGGGGRIGESFIGADGGAVRNVLIEDRAGVRADRASFALAHELGHVLLDDPGHPDDFGADTPTRLMDADAANPTAYGPRRLLVDECVRALRQSGPGSPAPLVSPWPLSPLVRQK